ncbi:hypothetical protein CYMTET_56297 [Cymbomonas tetramitiformis]|uniref:Uncharacterized protein n=1 Tax=Cymbomonas tetramitiformis TaxID=36881 RepID=A0AAE0ELZ3_9CHLO|nr:hypothetical protein CYMTET_56297 [Cymbomonas tetramitiformis]
MSDHAVVSAARDPGLTAGASRNPDFSTGTNSAVDQTQRRKSPRAVRKSGVRRALRFQPYVPRIIGSKSGYTPPRRKTNARGAPTRKPEPSEDAKKGQERFVRVGKDWESHDFLKALASHDPQIGKALSLSTGAVRVSHNAQSTQPFSDGEGIPRR